MKKKYKNRSKSLKEIRDYDSTETSHWIDTKKSLHFGDLGLKLPKIPPTQVVSIRLPSNLLNDIKALSSQRDIPYQALIKLFLAKSVIEMRKKFS